MSKERLEREWGTFFNKRLMQNKNDIELNLQKVSLLQLKFKDARIVTIRAAVGKKAVNGYSQEELGSLGTY